MSTAISVRLPKDLDDQLDGIAKETERPRSFIILKALESYFILKGQFAGLRKYRIGNYGVIYAIVGTDILVLRIGHRRDAYKGEI